MKLKDFKKLITFEEFNRDDDTYKFMYKIYLMIRLRGGRREPCYIYSVGRSTSKNTTDIKLTKKGIIDMFKKMVKEKKWIVETSKTEYFLGDKVVNMYDEESPKKYDKTIETTTKTSYYFNSERDIKLLERKHALDIFRMI